MTDVAIIGGGTAGCVLAEKLSRSGKLRITLVEAGDKPTNRMVSIPAGFTKLFKSDHDWAFESEPQTSVGGRRIFTPRGKMLGGSSNMNAQIHQWCHPADFDGWLKAGADGWGWEDVREVFRRQESWLGNDGQEDRGREGPMTVSPNKNALPLSHAFVEAARRSGLNDMPRYNGSAFEGAWICELAHKNGKRFSCYDAFLKPSMSRPNLEVITKAQVKRIEFDNGRASGVTYLRDGEETTLLSRAVVLSAGSFGSPQILMHSGIGPGEVLSQFDIPVRVDRRDVGENLQDHPVLPIVFDSPGSITMKSAEKIGSLLNYILFKRGMLASNGIEAFAFANSAGDKSAPPDIELIFTPLDCRDQFLKPPLVDAFGIGASIVAPRSRGRLTLRGADPIAAPLIDFGMLSDGEGVDREALLAAIRLTRKISETAPLAEFNAGELRPGPAVQNEDELLAYAAQEIQTVYHPTSTCRMGIDPLSVVDPKLKVNGVDGLWIADASVMPSVPRGHPNAVVAMIADRAADWIESDLA